MKDKLVLLHSNDMHGDFLAEAKDGHHIGGVSLLSGYVKQVRAENDNVLYAIAGDMFKGSVIDSEFLGFSTIEIMNYLNPDVVALGNHELDYGLAHLLFLEKCARFPIINANMYIKSNHVRLFSPYKILEVNGLKIMFIAVITEEVLSSTRSEPIVGTFVDVWEAARQVGVIVDNYKTTSVDLTVLLTHIGYKNDIELAKILNPKWGIDLIIGGHSHTLLSKPKIVNDIPIVQVGVGSDQIGRFDIEIDREEHEMTGYEWKVLPITSENCPVDEVLEKVLTEYKDETDRKYGRLLTILNRKLTLESKRQESELGNLFADLMQQDSSFDVMFYGTGSIRVRELGPSVQYSDLKEAIPFTNEVHMLEVTGRQFKDMCRFFLRQSIDTRGTSEFFNLSRGVRLVYDYDADQLEECTLNGKKVTDRRIIKIGVQDYHYQNFKDCFGIDLKEIEKRKRARTVVTDDFSVYEETLAKSDKLDSHIEGRIVIIKRETA